MNNTLRADELSNENLKCVNNNFEVSVVVILNH